ncbi:MAG TPA: hypothetical protein VFL12_11980 [Thermoanaerobaculia bacterium]|nr:hypothetical protein [Thermoanaerobaculia bacterium]
MPAPIWFFCTLCGETFPWPADKPGPTRCPVDGCPETDIQPAPAPGNPNLAPAANSGAPPLPKG